MFQSVRKVVHPLYAPLKGHISGILYPVLGSKKDTNLLKEVLERATNVIRSISHVKKG